MMSHARELVIESPGKSKGVVPVRERCSLPHDVEAAPGDEPVSQWEKWVGGIYVQVQDIGREVGWPARCNQHAQGLRACGTALLGSDPKQCCHFCIRPGVYDEPERPVLFEVVKVLH